LLLLKAKFGTYGQKTSLPKEGTERQKLRELEKDLMLSGEGYLRGPPHGSSQSDRKGDVL